MNILPGEKFIFPRFLLSLSALLMMALITQGCSDNGSDITLTNELGGGWVTIATPSDSGSATTYCDSAWVSGEAFISADYFRCCSGSATDTGVTVSWENLVTGTHGDASQAVDYCYLFGTPYLCNHTWQAEIPLILGDNIIQISAIDPGGAGGRDTITIYKPEYGYNLSGRVSTYDDLGLGYFQSGVELTLDGAVTKRVIPSSADGYGLVTGQYQFSCVPNGAYTLTATTQSFSYIFEPAFINFAVAGQDVFNLDFKTTAYPLSGTITDSSGLTHSSFISVTVDGGGDSWSWPVQQDGSYTYLVPNGSYTITPSDYFCLTCYFTPSSITVEVTDQGSSGLDFVWYP
jgi:hypothetical protein